MDKKKLEKLKELNLVLLEQKALPEAIDKASQLIKEIIEVDRVSIFIYEYKNNLVWTYKADELGKVVFSADKGIVGYVTKTKTIKVVNDTSKEPLFYGEVDKETGYKTINILAIPILDHKNRLIGVVELINKVDKFSAKDIAIANMFSNYISEPLENLKDKYKK